MARNPSGHNIYSGNKSKMVFQSPDDNPEKFDYINKVEEEENGSGSDSESKPASGSGLSNLGTQFCVGIMNKIAKSIKKMLRPNSDQDSDF